MYETFIFALLLIFFNFIFIIKRVPIIGIFVSIFTFFICVSYFIVDSTLPINSPNPVFTIFIALFAGISFIIQAWDMSKNKYRRK